MAITRGLLMQNVSGHVARQIVFKKYGEKTVVSKYPDMSQRELTSKQLRVNEIMANANYRAKGIIADPTLKNEALLRLNVTTNRLYTALVKEYFKAEKDKPRDGNGITYNK